jgi:SlyX protein
MTASLEQRLTELEVRIAFIENTVQALDAAVAAQDRAIAQFRLESELLRGELAQVRTALADDVHDEPPPPHY